MSCLGSFGPISLGDCGPKSKIQLDFNKISESVTSSVQQSNSESKSSVVLNQKQNVSIEGDCCDDLNIVQGLKVDTVDVTKMSDNFSSNIGSSIVNSLSNELEQNSKQITDLLGSTVGPNLSSSIKQTVSDYVKQESFKNAVKKSMKETFGDQGQNVRIQCGQRISAPGTGTGQRKVCNINQDFLFKQATNNILETVFKDISTNEQLNEVVNEAKQKSESEGKGLTDLVKSIFSGYAMIILGVVLIIFLPLIIFVIYKATKGRNAVKDLAKTATETSAALSSAAKEVTGNLTSAVNTLSAPGQGVSNTIAAFIKQYQRYKRY